jgi:hypothetical protein
VTSQEGAGINARGQEVKHKFRVLGWESVAFVRNVSGIALMGLPDGKCETENYHSRQRHYWRSRGF